MPTTGSTQLRNSVEGVNPAKCSRMDHSPGSSPRQGICALHLRRPPLRVQSGVSARLPSTVSGSEYAINAPAPRGGPGLPPRRVSKGEDARPILIPRRPTPAADQQIRGHSKGPQHGQVEANHRSLLPTRPQRQRWHRPSTVLALLHLGGRHSRSSCAAGTGRVARKSGYRIRLPLNPSAPARPSTLSSQVERRDFHRYNAAVRALIRSEDLQRSG